MSNTVIPTGVCMLTCLVWITVLRFQFGQLQDSHWSACLTSWWKWKFLQQKGFCFSHIDVDRHVQFVILTGVFQIGDFKLLIKIKPLFLGAAARLETGGTSSAVFASWTLLKKATELLGLIRLLQKHGSIFWTHDFNIEAVQSSECFRKDDAVRSADWNHCGNVGNLTKQGNVRHFLRVLSGPQDFRKKNT